MNKIITLLTFVLFLTMPTFASAATSTGGASDNLLEMVSCENGDKNSSLDIYISSEIQISSLELTTYQGGKDKKQKKAAKAAKKQRKHIARTGERKPCPNSKRFKKKNKKKKNWMR